MTITVEALLPWISFLAAIGAAITVFAKLRSQVERSLEKDKEQDTAINSCASKDDLAKSKEDIAKVEKRIDGFIVKYEHRHDSLAEKVNEHSETLAGLKSALDQLRQSVDRLANKIDSLKSIT